MHFKIYGSGCSKCQQLAANAEAAASALGQDCDIEKVTEVKDIVDAGVMYTPALAIDDNIIVEGKVASVEELQQLLG